MPEPRDPLLKVLIYLLVYSEKTFIETELGGPLAGAARVTGPSVPAEATFRYVHRVDELLDSVMIPPLVHQRRPCYDFYFL